MKYLVNRETKEHRLHNYGEEHRLGSVHGKWDVVDADDEGWIKWDGRLGCPLPQDALCEIVTKDDGARVTKDVLAARMWSWCMPKDDPAHIVSYRPILPADSKPEPLGYQAWDAATTYRESDKVMMPSGQVVTFGDITPGLIKKEFDSDTVFTRLSAAVAAADSIPALIAEINGMLPDGYEVREKAKTEQPAEDMSDWRNWKRGDLVTLKDDAMAISEVKHRLIYIIERVERDGFSIASDCAGFSHGFSESASKFKFHSRPVTK